MKMEEFEPKEDVHGAPPWISQWIWSIKFSDFFISLLFLWDVEGDNIQRQIPGID